MVLVLGLYTLLIPEWEKHIVEIVVENNISSEHIMISSYIKWLSFGTYRYYFQVHIHLCSIHLINHVNVSSFLFEVWVRWLKGTVNISWT